MARGFFVTDLAFALAVVGTIGCSDDEQLGSGSPDGATSDGSSSGGRSGTGGGSPTTGGRSGTTGGAGGVPSTTGGLPGTTGGGAGQPSNGGSAGSGGRPDAGAPEAGPPDAASPDGGPQDSQADALPPDASIPACLTIVPSDGGGWAPQPTPGNPSCVPNCDAASCYARCTTGVPCSTGCCAGTVSQHSISGGSAVTLFPDMALDASGRWHLVVNENGDEPVYLFGDATGSKGSQAIDDPLIPNGWSRHPHVTVPASGSPIHFAYALYSTIGSGPLRYGTLTGSTWAFETLPWTVGFTEVTDIELDTAGRPLILTHRALIHRTAAGWRVEPTPCGDRYSDLAVDSDGAWYFLLTRANVPFLARRSSTGDWTLTGLPAPDARLRIGFGTAHVVWGSGSGIQYARLVGSTWQTHTVLTYSSVNAPREIQSLATPPQFGLDACGSPHIMLAATTYYDQLSTTGFGSHYARWTSSGWREFPVRLGVGEAFPFTMAVGATHAYLAADESALILSSFPTSGP